MRSEATPHKAIQLETLDPAIINYIKELETNYNLRLKESENRYLELKERYDLLVYKRFARSAEQLLADKKQPLLFATEETSGKVKQEDYTFEKVKSHVRMKKGRKAIDPKIPREERIIDIAEEEKTCACGAKLTRIGEESSEKLHIIPPRIYVEKTIRPKYACRCCEGTEEEGKPTVRIAPVEPSIIPKSIVSPSLLSTIIIQKYEDHLPYHRQEKQFQRIMVTISRQDMTSETSFPMAATGIRQNKTVIRSAERRDKKRPCYSDGRDNGAGYGRGKTKRHAKQLYVACSRRASIKTGHLV